MILRSTDQQHLAVQPRDAYDLAYHALNAAAFARDYFGFDPDPIQARVLFENPHRLILNCNRQWGKSTMSAILVAHRAVFVPGSLCILAGPSERQAAETLLKVVDCLRMAGVRLTSDRINRHGYIVAANGSRIVALPSSEARVRGFSKTSLLVIDEASRVSDPLYYAIRPFLSISNGDLILLSTPFGKRGFFYQEYTYGGPRWTRFTVPGSDCPRIPADFLEENSPSAKNIMRKSTTVNSSTTDAFYSPTMIAIASSATTSSHCSSAIHTIRPGTTS